MIPFQRLHTMSRKECEKASQRVLSQLRQCHDAGRCKAMLETLYQLATRMESLSY